MWCGLVFFFFVSRGGVPGFLEWGGGYLSFPFFFFFFLLHVVQQRRSLSCSTAHVPSCCSVVGAEYEGRAGAACIANTSRHSRHYEKERQRIVNPVFFFFFFFARSGATAGDPLFHFPFHGLL